MEVIDVTHQFHIPLEYPRLRMQRGRVDGVAVHHTAVLWPRPDATNEEELNHIRAIDRYHREVRGFGGFGYHLIAFPTRRIYLVTPLTQWGAHVYQHNDHLYGIALAGLFPTTVPGNEQLEATAVGINHIFEFLGHEVRISPHRRWGGTSCPGDRWQGWVPTLAGIAEEFRQEDDMDEATVRRIVAEMLSRHSSDSARFKQIADNQPDLNQLCRDIIKQMIRQGSGGQSLEEIADGLEVEVTLKAR